MPAGRQVRAKRASPAISTASGMSEPESPSSTQGKSKVARLEKGPAVRNEFSDMVKNKLQSYTRTGQACDRCKVRKIRCDGLPEGCSHCISQNLECYVTDRVSGRTERRGYMQQLEREKNDMANHIRHLEGLLTMNGIQVDRWTVPTAAAALQETDNEDPEDTASSTTSGPTAMSFTAASHRYHGEQQHYGTAQPSDAVGGGMQSYPGGGGWSTSASLNNWDGVYASSFAGGTPMVPEHILPTSLPPNRQTGALVDQVPLSSSYGTTLSILGSQIDLGSIAAPDMDVPPPMAGSVPRLEPLYNKSLKAMLQSAFNQNPPIHCDYPSRNDAFSYAESFFQTTYPLYPILHKPSFMALLTRLYDDPAFVPSCGQSVTIHMLIAITSHQFAKRCVAQLDERQRLTDICNKHYHFSCAKVFHLLNSRTFDDCQAFTMFVVLASQFTKPDCAALLCHWCLPVVASQTVHRTWSSTRGTTNIEDELRKRMWWSLATTAVIFNGRTGALAPLRVEDIDVPFPELIADEYLTEDGVISTGSSPTDSDCPFAIGVCVMKLTPLFAKMYSKVYGSRRRPEKYLEVIRGLEMQLQRWEHNLPGRLKLGQYEATSQDWPMIYARHFALEFRLCLRHPSVTPTNNAGLLAESTKICEETATELLTLAWTLSRLGSLDATLCNVSLYVAAIFTILAAHWERRHSTTEEAFNQLSRTRDWWLVLLAEMSHLLLSSSALHDSVGAIIERTMNWIDQDRPQHTNTISSESPSIVAPPTSHPIHYPESAPNTASYQQSFPQQSHVPRSTEDAKYGLENRLRLPYTTADAMNLTQDLVWQQQQQQEQQHPQHQHQHQPQQNSGQNPWQHWTDAVVNYPPEQYTYVGTPVPVLPVGYSPAPSSVSSDATPLSGYNLSSSVSTIGPPQVPTLASQRHQHYSSHHQSHQQQQSQQHLPQRHQQQSWTGSMVPPGDNM